MTEREINKSIAECCGWTNCQYVESLRDVNGIPPKNWNGDLISGLDVAWIPHYCNDLNAMHEAEKIFITNGISDHIDSKSSKYAMNISRVCRDQLGISSHEATHHYIWPTYATAKQRAEAFLKTIGQWKE
jgi:hypothetical protein